MHRLKKYSYEGRGCKVFVAIGIISITAIVATSVARAEVQKFDPRLLPEIANDSRVKSGVNDAACVDTSYPQKFVRGIRTPYGAYCLEDRAGVEAFPTEEDIHTPQSPKRGNRISLDQLLQIMQIGYLAQQLAAINDLAAKTAELQKGFEKEVKSWQRRTVEDVISRIEKFPESFSSNKELVNAVSSAASAELLSSQQFIHALKSAIKE